MDGFAIVMFGGVGAVTLILWLLGRSSPGSGTDSVGLQSAREIEERRTTLEIEDDEQVREALAALRERRAKRTGQMEPRPNTENED
ncbi:MAG: hypothetical protein NTX07_01235 [Solirubrobacterales bacterium]|nr:hypothetical protein [Solirubrobacterales bacterium]